MKQRQVRSPGDAGVAEDVQEHPPLSHLLLSEPVSATIANAKTHIIIVTRTYEEQRIYVTLFHVLNLRWRSRGLTVYLRDSALAALRSGRRCDVEPVNGKITRGNDKQSQYPS